MTVRNPPIFEQALTHPAEDVRRFIATVFRDQEGVYDEAELKVTQNGTPNMSVNVAGGRAIILGDSATYQGSYFVENRGVENKAVTPADLTNPRIDRVIAELLDASYSGASNLWQLRVVAGTPAASPSAPALPVNAISLATLAIAAGASSVVTANITDTRTQYGKLIGVNCAEVLTMQSTTSTSYTDLATAGPSVSILTGTRALVTVAAQFVTSASSDGFMAPAVSGATTIAAANGAAYLGQSSTNQTVTMLVLFANLNPGINTFTAKYQVSTGTCNFLNRRISAVACF